jgi:hypothetical protein
MHVQFVRNLGVALAISVALAGVAVAAPELGPQAPAKSPVAVAPNVVDPTRQGGDTIETAVPITGIPFNDTGTTTGYTDDYDEMCPYGGGISPDVVYQFTPVATTSVDIDLCGSGYDTKVYVWDADLHYVACNDDYYFDADDACGQFVSKLVNVSLGVGAYYIVVDGYSGSGEYVMTIAEHVPCVVDCPAGGQPEGEPPLVPDYVDSHNGGCMAPGSSFQALVGGPDGALTFCGRSGWYTYQGEDRRDTDWFVFTMGPGGEIEVGVFAERDMYVLEIGPQDCAAVDVVQSALVHPPCDEVAMTITGYAPGSVVWFWAGPSTFAPPAGGENEYDYVVWFSGLEPAVATEATTWSTVKALYN